MKYQVQISYTNPSHEHVTLRRRVETVTRLVEASTEGEALNRAANQQRALGFRIQEAKVVKSASLNEGFDTDPKDIAAYLVDRHGKGKVTMDHIEAYERRRDSHRPIEKHEVMKHVKKMSEEVEQIDELKKSTLASYVNKAANQVRAKTGIAASFETQGTRKRDPENKAAYMGLAKDFRQGAKKRLTGIEKATAKLAKEEIETVDEADVTKDLRTSMKMMDLRHGVDADKRDKGYKMSATVRAAQKKFDAQSKGQGKMRPQAGTLAALKKEAVDPGETRVVNKAVKTSKKATKAAEKMVSAAKGKLNKINVKPTMDLTGQEKSQSKA